jgi:tRNA pseudouridine55 synthase
MGRRARKPRGFRDVDGILLLNKPIGLSSNKALQAARNLFKANKAGHTGSLDPLATGLLPVCFGEATKFSGYLLDASKSYHAVCQLGQTSSTGDGEGELTEAVPVTVSDSDIQQVVERFKGKIQQIPPMHSAVKHQGKRLYDLARQGVEVERKSREIEIYSLDVLSFTNDQLELDVHCSKGTYVRTLAEDIGHELGCGAYLAALERTGVQPFWGMKSYTLDELRAIADDESQQLDDCLLPMQAALADWPAIELSDDLSFYLRQGQPVQVPRAPTSGYVRLLDEAKGFIGAGVILADGRVAPKRMLRT